jgi:O-antigen ligase
VTSAHNSIVQVATELGIPAAIIACAYLFGVLTNAGQLFEREPSAFSLFALLFLVAFAVMSFAEAHLLQIHWSVWILFVALTATVERELERSATHSAASPSGTHRFDADLKIDG